MKGARNTMPRIAREVHSNVPHHVTQRGNGYSLVFDSPMDRQVYTRYLREYASRYAMEIWAYCLMSNHVHFIAVPRTKSALAKTFREANTRYAVYLNRRRASRGRVWGERFHSSPLDERHLWVAVRYVEQNPVRAGIVETADQYAWSSARAHCHGEPDSLLDPGFPRDQVISDWTSWLKEGIDDPRFGFIRQQTRVCRPCSGDCH